MTFPASPRPITQRHVVIAKKLVAGESYAAIAASLGLAYYTVRSFAADLLHYYEVTSQAELIKILKQRHFGDMVGPTAQLPPPHGVNGKKSM